VILSEQLAIDGGTPVRSQLLPYARQIIDEQDIVAVDAVLRSAYLTTGPAVASFERAFAAAVSAPEAVAVANGTAALHAAVFEAGIGDGDEVIVPALTFAATANAVRYCGGRPIFADVEPDTGLIDVQAVRDLMSPRTKAIIAVDYAGQPCDAAALTALAAERGVTFIEDAAHAVGATYQGRPVGTLADMTTFSFHPVKPMTSGEGGIITTADAAAASRMRAFRNHGINRDARMREAGNEWLYDIEFLGYNYRLPDILCALGESQLAKLPQWLARREEIAAAYDTAFADLPHIQRLRRHGDRTSAWHLYVVLLDFTRLRVGRREVFQALRAEGIGVNVHYVPVYWHSVYVRAGYARGLCPTAETFYERAITLPLWPGMDHEDVQSVIDAVEKVCRAYER
jgi:perosamine synthetase